MESCSPIEVMYERRCARFIYIAPSGLRELMSDISREVLRYHPTNMYEFIADYLDALLITRENARVACKIVDRITESSILVAKLLKHLKITKEQANRAAVIIQRAFRKYLRDKCLIDDNFQHPILIDKLLRRCKISIEQAYSATLTIQRAYRAYRIRREAKDPCGEIDWREAASRTIRINKDRKMASWEMERAATLIKAAYKGYYTRKTLKDMVKKQAARTVTSEIKETISKKDSELCFEGDELQLVDYDEIMKQIQEKAATVIQQAFRKHLEIKESHLIELTESLKEEDPIPFPFQKLIVIDDEKGSSKLVTAVTSNIDGDVDWV